jgi:hypothetical protein
MRESNGMSEISKELMNLKNELHHLKSPTNNDKDMSLSPSKKQFSTHNPSKYEILEQKLADCFGNGHGQEKENFVRDYLASPDTSGCNQDLEDNL